MVRSGNEREGNLCLLHCLSEKMGKGRGWEAVCRLENSKPGKCDDCTLSKFVTYLLKNYKLLNTLPKYQKARRYVPLIKHALVNIGSPFLWNGWQKVSWQTLRRVVHFTRRCQSYSYDARVRSWQIISITNLDFHVESSPAKTELLGYECPWVMWSSSEPDIESRL